MVRIVAGLLQQPSYEEPTQADLVLGTHELDVDECVDRIMKLLEKRGVVKD